MLENHREMFTANREAIETVYSSQLMARATSPSIPRSESETPRKWPKFPAPGVNRPKMGQNPVNLEMSPKFWEIIGECPIPIERQLRQSMPSNLCQTSTPRPSRDLILNQQKKWPKCPPRGINMPQMGQKSEIYEITPKCFKLKCSQPKGK